VPLFHKSQMLQGQKYILDGKCVGMLSVKLYINLANAFHHARDSFVAVWLVLSSYETLIYTPTHGLWWRSWASWLTVSWLNISSDMPEHPDPSALLQMLSSLFICSFSLFLFPWHRYVQNFTG